MTGSIAIAVPRESNNDEVVTLVKWCCRDGEEVRAEQVVAEVEGSKATFEVIAPAGGFVKRMAQVGQDVGVGEPLCRLFATRAAAESWAPATDQSPGAETGAAIVPGAATAQPPHDFVRFSRRAQALLEQRGLAPASFEGRGLVRSRDVLAALGESAPAAARAAPRLRAVGSDGTGPRSDEPAPSRALQAPATRHALAPSKRTEARYLGAGHRTMLPSSVTVAVATDGLRAAIARSTAFDGNATALIVYECARLLRKYPLFNACYDEGEAYVYDGVNVGVAVDGGHGLKVPVIRGADTKTPGEVAAELRELLVAYAANELTAEQQSGGTFTVTDLSGSNVLVFEPLINRGQAAILGVGAEILPAGGAGSFNLTLRFDHQLAEGRTAAAFLNDLAARLKGHEAAVGTAVADAPRAARCARCYRTHQELRSIDRHLLQTIGAGGANEVLCTVCIQGW